MLKKRKEYKITLFKRTIISLIGIIASICGIVVFSYSTVTDNILSNFGKAFILLLSIWNIIFAMINLTSSKKENSEEKFKCENYVFQMTICIEIITVILLLLIALVLIL